MSRIVGSEPIGRVIDLVVGRVTQKLGDEIGWGS
jgi:hypothetical protein